ncbi:MAG: hypothetical protein KW793_04210 [Candidatus Doudnabacteria bacterium]|nr:hypothetical protein [Candidatus Doudnabacteria bacterium]
MATAGELLGYTGNANLGLGSNSDIPVSNPSDLGFTNQNLRDIALQDHQNNILKWKQKIDERDKLYEALSTGQMKIGDTLERDMPTVNKALDEQTQAFQDWMKKGYGDIDGAIAYRKATQKASEVTVQAQARKAFFDRENADISKEPLPKFQQSRKQNLDSNLGNFWGDLVPYEPTARLDIGSIEKFAQPYKTEFSDPKRPLEKAKRTYFSYNDTLKNAGAYALTPDGLYNLQQFHDTLQGMQPLDLYNKVKDINRELDRYNKERGLTAGQNDYAAPIQMVPQYEDGKLSGVDFHNEPLDKLAAKFSLAGQAAYQSDAWELDKSKEALQKLAIDREKLGIERQNAQSNRIRANATAQRAGAYSRLQGLKAKQMTDEEKHTRGFWDGIVDKIESKQVREKKDGPMIDDDYIFTGNLPKGYRFNAGVNSKGEPIELHPFTTPQGVPFYKTKKRLAAEIPNSGLGVGDEVSKQFLADAWKRSKALGKPNTRTYDEYIKSLIRNGTLDLEIEGETEEYSPDKKTKIISRSTANFESALQSAKALSNKSVSSKLDEPLFDENQEPEPE